MGIPLRELQHCNTATLQQLCRVPAVVDEVSTATARAEICRKQTGRLPKAEAEFARSKITHFFVENSCGNICRIQDFFVPLQYHSNEQKSGMTATRCSWPQRF